MRKLIKYLSKQQWLYIAVCIVFIVGQVWLDLKLPDYMSAVTTLVQTEGSSLGGVLTQGGYMLLCALGRGLCSVVVGIFRRQDRGRSFQNLAGEGV